MLPSKIWDRIKEPWLSSVSKSLSHGAEIQESFLEQLRRFFDLLRQSIETSEPARLDVILQEWVRSRTQIDLQQPEESSVLPVLDQLLILTSEVAAENLTKAQATKFTRCLLPSFTHAIEFIARQELQIQTEHFSFELERTTMELERLDKSKSDFIAVAAHELKTPLTLIEGYSSMLREILSPLDKKNKQIDVYLEGIANGQRRLKVIVDDMIDVSMIDNKLLSIKFQPVWLKHILEVVQREFMETLQERGQTLTIHEFPGLNEMTYGDGERLIQAFSNVVSNAIKFTPDGGMIMINGRTLPGFMEITITDNGIGIDPENHIRIFEKFGRLGDVSLHSSGKTKFKGGGPGLGLPITKGIIDAHGGTIWVESEGNDEEKCPGSVFHILIPIRKSPPDAKSARLFELQVEPAHDS